MPAAIVSDQALSTAQLYFSKMPLSFRLLAYTQHVLRQRTGRLSPHMHSGNVSHIHRFLCTSNICMRLLRCCAVMGCLGRAQHA